MRHPLLDHNHVDRELDKANQELDQIARDIEGIFAALQDTPLTQDVEREEKALVEELRVTLGRRQQAMARLGQILAAQHMSTRLKGRGSDRAPKATGSVETFANARVGQADTQRTDTDTVEDPACVAAHGFEHVSSSSPHVRALLDAASQMHATCEVLQGLIEVHRLSAQIATTSFVWQAQECERIQALVHEGLEPLAACESHIQVSLCEMVQARVRAMQQIKPGDRGLKDLHFTLRRFLEAERPGFAHGFSLGHQPQHGSSWHDDARELEARLFELVSIPTLQEEGPTPPSPSSKVRETDAQEDSEDDDDVRTCVVDASWPWRGHTEGRRAVIFGGSPRPGVCQRYEDAFGFDNVMWLEESDSSASRLASWIQGGRVDFAIITRFCKHKHTLKMADTAKMVGGPCLRLPQGYGTGAFKAVVEENLTTAG